MESRRATYLYGNTVRQAQIQAESKNRILSQEVKNNRKAVEMMNMKYVGFLAVAAVVVLFTCMQYLQLQSANLSHSSSVTSLQRELANIKMENDAALGAIEDSVNLELIKERASALGMVYVDNNQIMEYSSPTNDFVKQYQNIPENGVIAQ